MLAGSLANPWKVRLVLTWSRNLRIPMPTLDRISNYVTTTRVTQKNWDVNTSEAATRVVLYKKVFFEISQKSQKNTCARVSFLLKKRLWHRCFPMNFAKFPRTTFLKNTSGWLLLILLEWVGNNFSCIWEISNLPLGTSPIFVSNIKRMRKDFL